MSLAATQFGDWLFENLPEAAQWRDETEADDALQQLCAVLGVGIDEITDEVENLIDVVDPDAIPAELLPALAQVVGIEFPFDLGVERQRTFVRNAVALYRIKGSTGAMTQALARLLGSTFRVAVTAEDYAAHTLDLDLSAPDGAALETNLETKVLYLVGQYTPAGLVPTLLFRYFGSEQMPATRAYTFETIEYTAWACNKFGHKLNTFTLPGQAFGVNGFGEVPLTI